MKKIVSLLLIIMLAAFAAACGTSGKEAEGGLGGAAQAGSGAEQAEGPAAGAGQGASAKATVYPITVKDASGTELTFEKAPERIVSTSPSETEILFALGLGDKIYGVSDFDNYPEAALSKPKVGGVVKPNEEAIIAANADLVIGGISMSDDISKKFRELGMKVYKTEPNTIEDVLSNILQLGVVTDKQLEAEQVVEQMRKDIQTVVDAASKLKEEEKKKVYIEFNPGWTVGKGEFMDEMITLIGGINIAGDLEGWKKINEEKVIQDNPDVILYTADIVDKDSGKPLDELIKTRSGWDQIKAIQEGRLAAMDQDLLSRPGPRITKGLLAMMEAVYPGRIKQ